MSRRTNLATPHRFSPHSKIWSTSPRDRVVIVGRVTAEREASIELTVYDKDGGEHTLRAVVDTGYDGWLTLTETVTIHTGLPWRRRGRGWLADGSETVFDIHE